MKRLKLGIIGFGKQGSYYARKYLETDACKEIELVAVSDNNKARIDWARGHIENVTFFDDAIAMLDSGLIEACQIVIANKEHYRFIHECLIRGIHVLCEKPLCLNTYEARSIIAEAKKHPDLVFGLMLNQRMNPLYRRLKELIDNKTYGKILRINWTITDWYRSQAYFNNNYWHGTWIGEGGGVLINQAIHQLDLWQWLFGLPAKIESKLCIGKAHDIETEDEAYVFMEYDDGKIGTFITSTNDPCGVNRLEIQVEKGKIVIENKKLMITEIVQDVKELENDPQYLYKKPANKTYEIDIDDADPKHEGVINDFAKAVLHGNELMIKGEEGLKSLILCNGIYLSFFLNKEISLPFDDEVYLKEFNKRAERSKFRDNARDDMSGIFSSYADRSINKK